MRLEKIEIHDVGLNVAKDSRDLAWYRQRGCYEEVASPLYNLLKLEGYSVFVDVGANYGLISILAKKRHPSIKVYALEADPRLVPVIERNFALNGIKDAEVFNVIAAATDKADATFSLNPNSTLDNRVAMSNWQSVNVQAVSLSSLLSARISEDDRAFIKIDTQGYEQHVLTGAERLLQSLPHWAMKMEFAPRWLRSQGTDPRQLLNYLFERYRVAEFPPRLAFGVTSLDDLLHPLLDIQHAARFLAWVESLNADGSGWVDLLITPFGRGRQNYSAA